MPPRRRVDPRAFLTLLEQRAPRPLTIQQMAELLALDRYDRKEVRTALEAQVASHTLRRIGKTRYRWVREIERGPRPPRTAGTTARGKGPRGSRQGIRVEGRYARVRAGFGFVEVPGRAADHFARDILIREGDEGAALHGDRVEVEIVRRDRQTRRALGRITAVTGPAHERIIGTLKHLRHGWCVIPESQLLPPVDIIGGPTPRREDAEMVALVYITRAATPGRGPGGEIEKVLGEADDPEVQFLSIAYEHGLRVEFPPEAVAEAEGLPTDPSEKDFAGREDLRHLPFATIDSETARDFDDAVYMEKAKGGYRLLVAIADVSHYVRQGSALDAEAAARGTSVYFPDRAIPMLPPKLSSQLCSLNPDRDRLVLVADMRLSGTGRRLDTQLYRAVITSKARLTYTKVAAVLSDTDTPEIRGWRAELEPVLPELRCMHELMGKLNRNRLQAGSLDLDLPESLINISEEGRSIGVRLFQRNDAHRLIEELMLEANCAVAAFLREQGPPFPYRIHEPPDPGDIDSLNQFLEPFGFNVRFEDRVEPGDIQRLLVQLQGHRLARVLSRQVLRSLAQARYSQANTGHFGLAFPVYCHFTSPIRRYPDLLVHRQLGRLLDGRVAMARDDAEAIEAASVQSSQAERQAMDAERAMLDLKKAELMLDHLLEPELGTIVSVTSFGFFVELDAYPSEGLVRADDLTDDRYYLIEEERALKGIRKGQRFRLGDRVLVEATNVSLRRRQIDFALLRAEREKRKAKSRGKKAEGRRRKTKS